MKTFIINHLKLNNCAIVVIDPKGDLALQIAQAKINLEPQRKGKTVIIDPYLKGSYTPIFNPLDQFPRDEHQVDLTTQELTKTLSQIFLDFGAEFSSRMETLLSATLGTLLRKEGSTLWDLQRFMTDDCDDLIELGKLNPNVAHRNMFLHGEFKDVSYKETKRGIYDRLQRLLSTSTFANLITGASTVNLQQEINEKKLIIFNLAKGRMGSDVSHAFGRLIVSLLQIIALQRDGKPFEERVVCHIFIDEFQNYISEGMKEILAELRAYRLYLTLANQLVGQDMDENLTNMILGNTQLKAVGMSGWHNVNQMSKELGVDSSYLWGLGRGEFYLKIENNKAYRYKVTRKYRDFVYSMSILSWHQMKKCQISQYYVLRGSLIQQYQDEQKRRILIKPRKGKRKRSAPPDFTLSI